MSETIGVVGAGGWGIALAKLLADKGEQVTLWCHGGYGYQELQRKRESSVYLGGIILPPARPKNDAGATPTMANA